MVDDDARTPADGPREQDSDHSLSRALLEAIPDLVFFQDLEGRYIDCKECTGYPLLSKPSEFIGRMMDEVLPPAILAAVREPFEHVARTGEPQTVIYRHIRDGETFYYEARLARSGDRIITIVRDVTVQHRSARSRKLLLEHQAVLVGLERTSSDDIRHSLRLILETAAETLQVERAAFWRLNDTHTELACDEIFVLSSRSYAPGVTLDTSLAPRYFEAMDKAYTIPAHDVFTDPRTSEFSETYAEPLGITSMLDAPVRRQGRLAGVLCFEHVGPARTWSLEEQEFVASIADLVTIVLETAARTQLEQVRTDEIRTLKFLSLGRNMDQVLGSVVELVERQMPGSRASIQLFDPEKMVLNCLAAPSLPGFSELLTDFPVNEESGCCGRAVLCNMVVCVEDVLKDDRWVPLLDVARQYEIRSCWSHPIRSPDGSVLGTISTYSPEPGLPSTVELENLEHAANIAGIAINRLRVEEELQNSRERFSLALEGTSLGIWDADFPGNRVYIDERWATMLGYDVDEVGHTFESRLAMIHPADLPSVLEVWQAHIEGRTPSYQSEYRMRCKNGDWIWIEDRGRVVRRDAEGQPLRASGTHLDITDRMTSESRLRELNRMLLLHIENTPMGIVEWSPNFEIRRWTPQAERIFGWSEEEVIGRSFEDWRFVHDDDIELVRTRVLDLKRDGTLIMRNRNYDRDGRVVYCEWYNSCLYDDAGDPISFLSLILDVTERAHADQQQALMVAELNHRVKNNLATVLALADQTAARIDNFEAFRVSFLGRVNALLRTHSLLAETRWRGMHLGEMTRLTLEAFWEPGSSRITTRGPNCLLPARSASPLCMALHELAANAAKYGALSVPEGQVVVEWTITGVEDAPETLTLTWTESNGPVVSEPDRRGLGTMLIKDSIEFELGGTVELEYPSAGFRYRVFVDLRSPRVHTAPTPAVASVRMRSGHESTT